MKLKYHGYHSPQDMENLRAWLFVCWHDFCSTGDGGTLEERGIQVLGCYAIWQRVRTGEEKSDAPE